jgi:hypothetical protein
MEHFFLPFCLLRYQDILDEQSNSEYDPHEYTDIQLAVPMEDFLVYRWDWKDLRAFLTGGVTTNIFWITGDAFLVVRESGNVHLIIIMIASLVVCQLRFKQRAAKSTRCILLTFIIHTYQPEKSVFSGVR